MEREAAEIKSERESQQVDKGGRSRERGDSMNG